MSIRLLEVLIRNQMKIGDNFTKNLIQRIIRMILEKQFIMIKCLKLNQMEWIKIKLGNWKNSMPVKLKKKLESIKKKWKMMMKKKNLLIVIKMKKKKMNGKMMKIKKRKIWIKKMMMTMMILKMMMKSQKVMMKWILNKPPQRLRFRGECKNTSKNKVIKIRRRNKSNSNQSKRSKRFKSLKKRNNRNREDQVTQC